MRGWVTVTPTTDEPERRFAVGSAVLLDGRPRTVRDVRLGGRLTVLLEGCSNRDDAEALRGLWLYAEADQDPPTDPDEFYDHQLEGLQVRVDDHVVGRVEEVVHLPGQDLLVVSIEDRQALVPFVADIVPEIDLAGGWLRIEPPEGLLDAD